MSLHDKLNHVSEVYISSQSTIQLLVVIICLFAFVTYLLGAWSYKKWPPRRTIFFSFGIFSVVISLVGPLAERAHMDFSTHMLGHLLLGMLAPLLIALGAPMTLLLRTVKTSNARRITRFLRNRLVRLWTNPVIASLLNIGGLWALYTTVLYHLMHESILLYWFIHFHVFAAGYLFTISMIYIDPIIHRYSFLYRAIVLVLSLAGHGILAKFIYAHPPAGVPLEQAQQGAMFMYYGGDAIDIVIIFILCLHWFKRTRPRGFITVQNKNF